MRPNAIALISCLTVGSAVQAYDPPDGGKELKWLHRFVGEWDSEFESPAEPGQPAIKGSGKIKYRMLGANWLFSQSTPMSSIIKYETSTKAAPAKHRFAAPYWSPSFPAYTLTRAVTAAATHMIRPVSQAAISSPVMRSNGKMKSWTGKLANIAVMATLALVNSGYLINKSILTRGSGLWRSWRTKT